MPGRWERFDDVALLPASAFAEGAWRQPPLAGALDERTTARALWEAVASALGAERLARKGEIQGPDRRPSVELLLGDDDRVVRVESGVRYAYRLTRSMFSMGNVEERRRMGSLDCRGETVLDLYSGIGYYALPMLVHSGAERVMACDWSDDALAALAEGLRLNGVEDRCEILSGDNREHGEALAQVADRVLLGLIPNAWDGLPIALAALRSVGGVLHLHGTAPTRDHPGWLEDALGRCRIEELRLAVDRGRDARGIAPLPRTGRDSPVIRVKSHSPRWDHVVVDLRVG